MGEMADYYTDAMLDPDFEDALEVKKRKRTGRHAKAKSENPMQDKDAGQPHKIPCVKKRPVCKTGILVFHHRRKEKSK